MLKFQMKDPEGTTCEFAAPAVRPQTPAEWKEWGDLVNGAAWQTMSKRFGGVSPLTDLSSIDVERVTDECFLAGAEYANRYLAVKELATKQSATCTPAAAGALDVPTPDEQGESIASATSPDAASEAASSTGAPVEGGSATATTPASSDAQPDREIFDPIMAGA